MAALDSGMMTALVVQSSNIALLAKVLQQQKVSGLAAIEMIAESGVPQQGAPEPGKGSLVDVVA